MAAHPSSLGVVDRVDGRLNAWILAWNAHALLGDPAHVFGAPIFHPLPDALAFTENLLLPSLVVAPATLLGGPVLGYNLAFLASAVASGLGVQWLVRRITGAPLGAFVAGAAFAWGGQRLVRMAHLHAELTLFLPFLLVALDLFWEERTWRRAALIGLLVALQGWSSIYMGAIAATVVAVTLACMAVGGLGRGGFLRLACACLLAATLLAPVAVPYLRMRAFQGVEFTLADQVLHATTLESYAAPPGRLLGPLVKRHMDGTRIREALFPGLTLLVLGLAGLASAPRRWRLVALAAAACAILVSLGPETRAYRFVYEEVVFFRGLRALGRFAVVPVLVLSALAGLALAGARKRAVALALGLVVIEAWNRPLHYGVYEPPGPASRWLSGREGAVASLPLGEDDTRAMLRGIAHFRPLLNGDSGFVPRSYARVRELLAPPRPSSDGLRFLRAVGVSEIQARGDPGLPLLARFGGEAIYAVPPGPAAGPPRPGDPAVVVWEGKRAMVDLGTARVVGRVAFEVGDAPWIERPRLLLSEDGEGWERVVGSASLADATLSLTRRPTAGLGEIVFRSRRLRLVRLDPELPLRRGIVWVAP
jgi:hypothetical protein